MKYAVLCIFLSFYSLQSASWAAEGRVVVHRPSEEIRAEDQYPLKLLNAALQAHQDTQGKLTAIKAPAAMSRLRALREMTSARTIDVLVSPPAKEWDSKTIRIQIPIARGLLSYRVFFVREKNLPILHAVETLEDLKKIPSGSGTHWSLRRIYEANGFNTVLGVGEDSLISMLKNERFIIFGRGLNEVFHEYPKLKKKIPDLVIDQKYLLYVHMPTYFYVAPHKPELAARIEQGLKTIHANGEFDRVFRAAHGDALEQANLSSRTLFHIPNPNLDPDDFAKDLPYIYPLK